VQGQFGQIPKEFHDLFFQSGERKFEGRAAGVDDNRPLLTQFREVQAHGFAEAAFDPVSDIRASQGARSGKADTRQLSLWLRQIECGKVRTGVAFAGVVNESKVGGS
jgi:hypothetical protein